jgi:hypothetical protein
MYGAPARKIFGRIELPTSPLIKPTFSPTPSVHPIEIFRIAEQFALV